MRAAVSTCMGAAISSTSRPSRRLRTRRRNWNTGPPFERQGMKRIEVTITVAADVGACFDFVAEPGNVSRYMTSVKSYEPVTKKTLGKGARFRSVIAVGGREIEAELEVTDWVDNERTEAVSIKGPKTRGSWIFEEFDDGTTDVTLIHEYELPGIF